MSVEKISIVEEICVYPRTDENMPMEAVENGNNISEK